MVVSPLAGKRVLVTRDKAQAASLVTLLEARGATALCIPTIEIAPPVSWQPLDQALGHLDRFDLVILTSVNGVCSFVERLQQVDPPLVGLARIQVVAVGPKTAAALERYAIRPALVPQDYRAEGVVKLLLQQGVAGKRILFPRAELARSYIIDHLNEAGAEVVAPIAYRTICPAENASAIETLLKQRQIEAICLSSPSTFNNLLSMLSEELQPLLREVRLFSIGPQTSAAIRSQGFEVALEPKIWTLDALVETMETYYRN